MLAYLVIALLLNACSPPMGDAVQTTKASAGRISADSILINGNIYTMDKARPWVEAVAIKGKKFIYAGSYAEAKDYQDYNTHIIDLVGKMAMPGLVDAHVHPVLGGIEAFQCIFSPAATPEQIKAKLRDCIAANPDGEWIIGGRWGSDFFRAHSIDSPRQWLDAITADKAISLADDTGHNRWVNSKALAATGIGRDTMVQGGEILQDENGRPSGILLEAAMYPVLAAIPDWTLAQYEEAARASLLAANQFGITAIKEAGDAHQGVRAYKALADKGEANVHMAVSITIPLKADLNTLDMEKLERLRRANRHRNINTDYVKIFLDGVPSTARTAAMLEDYLPTDGGGETHNGKLLVPAEVLAAWITALDDKGITVTVHTAGDRAVRVTLDAIEQARLLNGDSGLQHQLAHAGLIHESDLPRFAELNAVADMSPAIWYPSPIIDSIISALGERGRRYWPVKDLLDAGAIVIAGSDWPAVIPDMNPWPGIEALITRKNPFNLYPGALWPEQAISLEQALEIYITNGLKILKMEQQTGTIQAGKLADLIVLDQNIFDIDPDKISDTQVLMTFFEGKIVYQQ